MATEAYNSKYWYNLVATFRAQKIDGNQKNEIFEQMVQLFPLQSNQSNEKEVNSLKIHILSFLQQNYEEIINKEKQEEEMLKLLLRLLVEYPATTPIQIQLITQIMVTITTIIIIKDLLNKNRLFVETYIRLLIEILRGSYFYIPDHPDRKSFFENNLPGFSKILISFSFLFLIFFSYFYFYCYFFLFLLLFFLETTKRSIRKVDGKGGNSNEWDIHEIQ